MENKNKSLVDWYVKKSYPVKPSFMQVAGKPDWIYLMHAFNTDMYKVGISNDPYRRLNEVRNGSPFVEIDIVCALQLEIGYDESAQYIESMVQLYFHRVRVKGEWFRFSKRDLVQLRSLMYNVEGWAVIDYQLI